MIKCPNCGADLEFDAKSQSVTCPYCASTFDPSKLDEKISKSKEQKGDYESLDGKSYSCSQCGATLMTFDDTAVTFCSYCGSQAMIETKDKVNQNTPDYIIPFSITKENCKELYKKKINSCFFVPNYMKDKFNIEKFRGIYMPYAIYKFDATKGNGSGEKYSHRSGDYVYYDQYDVNVTGDFEIDGVSFDLSSNYYDRFSSAIPHNYNKKQDFNSNYLAGYYADCSDVDKNVYYTEAISIAQNEANKKIRNDSRLSKYGCNSVNMDFSCPPENIKFAYLPVYFLAIKNQKYDKLNYAVINGQTGEIAMDLPIDTKKYVIASLVLATIIFFILNSFLVLSIFSILIIIAIISVISFSTTKILLKKIKARQINEDDKGLDSIKKDNKNKKEKIKTTNKKTLIAMILSIIVIFIQSSGEIVDDEFFYSMIAFNLLLIILSFADLIQEHNELMFNKPPQLEKRGGEDIGK